MFRKLLTLLVTCQPQELGNMATTLTKKARAHCREVLPVSLCELVRLENALSTFSEAYRSHWFSDQAVNQISGQSLAETVMIV